MRECNICFLPKNDNEFFKLECCPNNLCNECKSKLVKTIERRIVWWRVLKSLQISICDSLLLALPLPV